MAQFLEEKQNFVMITVNTVLQMIDQITWNTVLVKAVKLTGAVQQCR